MADPNDFVKMITKKTEDFSGWYVDIVRKAELADYSPMKGMMVIRPYGYEIWEHIQKNLDRMFKETGHRNAYFPLFIPESFLKKEAAHVKGFAPEVAWVTHGGGEALEERLAVRPTSEAIICSMYAKWVKSWRDLPLLINQWANVVRWEKVTRPFLRTTEFLWQEGHTVHATHDDAEEETLKILNIYKTFTEEYLAVPMLAGQKSDSEKFAGALRTYAIEALMPDGKALQAGTSHNLGQNFSKAFNIRYESKEQKLEYAWQTSWGVSTRLVGAMVMTHGDDSGLILPPRLAPIQCVVIPITMGNWQETVPAACQKAVQQLHNAGIRFHLDERDGFTPGWKFSDWEMRGVPLRIEIGPKDVQKQQAVMVNRMNREKVFLPMDELAIRVSEKLAEIQKQLLQKALANREQNTFTTLDYKEFGEILAARRGLIRTGWCGNPDCESKIKQDTSATIRVMSAKKDPALDRCPSCQNPARHSVWYAKSY